MIASARAWWQGLARRERRMVACATALLAVALLYMIGIEPAWRARARLERDIPQLQEQLAELEALQDEARLLRQKGVASVASGGSLQASLERSLARAGVAAKLSPNGERSVAVNATSVPAQSWFAWLEEFCREGRVRVVRARVTRAGAAGVVDADVGLEFPAR
jgi:general secretion pathway protein M